MTRSITSLTAGLAMAGFLVANGQAQNNTQARIQAQGSGRFGHIERVDKVYGKTVYSSDNQKIGNLNNLVVDLESGRILYAVIGASKGRVAVPPQVFTSTPGDNEKNVRLNIPKNKIETAPEFGDYDKPEDLGKAEFANKVYQHFGQNAWWQGNQPADQGSFHNVHKASQVIGMTVQNVNNAPIGKVQNLAVDLPAGRVTYVIFAPSGNIKTAGDQLYALPPDAFTLSSDQKHLVSNLDQAKMASAPHFDKNNWAMLSDPSFASQVYQYYGKQAYFGEGSLRPTGR